MPFFDVLHTQSTDYVVNDIETYLMFHSGVWDIDRAIKEIKAYPTFDQLCFVTQNAIEKVLVFQSSEKV